MTVGKLWSVEVSLHEDDSRTRAEAHLVGSEHDLSGRGVARRNPRDNDIPEIGDELAAARALSELAHELLHSAAEDIEKSTSHPVTLPS